MMPDDTPADKHVAAVCAPALSPSSDPLTCNPKATQGQSLSSWQVLPNAPGCAVTAKAHGREGILGLTSQVRAGQCGLWKLLPCQQ